MISFFNSIILIFINKIKKNYILIDLEKDMLIHEITKQNKNIIFNLVLIYIHIYIYLN